MLGKFFLQLSLKSQIYFALFLLILVCFSLMFFFLIVLSIELISQTKIDRKKFFYDLGRKNIDSSIFFQNLCIIQYDQLMKLINNQVYYLGKTFGHIFITMGSLGQKCKEYDPATYEEELEKSKNDNYTKLYYYCYGNKIFFQMFLPLLETSVLIKCKSFKAIRIIYYGNDVQFLNGFIFYLNYYNAFFSLDIKDMKDLIDNVGGDNMHQYIIDKIVRQKEKLQLYFDKYLNHELDFFQNIFTYPNSIFDNYFNETDIEQNYDNSTEEYIEYMSYNFMFLDYANNQLFLVNIANIERNTVMAESRVVENYLELIYHLLRRRDEFDVIPLYTENNTIISVNLCFLNIIKQMLHIDLDWSRNKVIDSDDFSEFIDKIRKSLKKGESKIDDCFISNYIYLFEKKYGSKYNNNMNTNIKKIFSYNFDNYYDLNFTESHMFFRNTNTEFGKYYFGIKHKFPDYASALNFGATYFLLNQINLYSFTSFYPSYRYYTRSIEILTKCLMVTIFILIYIWIILSIILFCIAENVISDIVKPISHLQSLVDNSLNSRGDNKEENINFNIDENIKNLCILTKNLLSNTKFDVQKFGNSDENSSENTLSSKNFQNNLILNEKLLDKNRNLQIEEENAINNCITIYRDYSCNNKNLFKKNLPKNDCLKNNNIDDDKNKLYRELMKMVECIENPLNEKTKDINKTIKTVKSNEIRNSLITNEKGNKNHLYKTQKYIKRKNNILYHWYLDAKNNIENKYLDIDREKSLFCKTNYNFD